MRPIARNLGHKLTLFKKEVFKRKNVPVLLLQPGFYTNAAIAKGHWSVTLLRSSLPFLSCYVAFFLLISPTGLFSNSLASPFVPAKRTCQCIDTHSCCLIPLR